MSKKEKRDKEILEDVPIPTDITPDELLDCLKRKGANVRPGKGSHLVLVFKKRDGSERSWSLPGHGKKTIKTHYIKEARDLLKELDE